MGSFSSADPPEIVAAGKIGEWRAVSVAGVMMLAVERVAACG
jgi:hypothetical protein